MAWLGVRAGALNLLLPVGEVAEVLPCTACTTVPLTQPWFRGLNNVRGSLYSVIDLPALLGYAPVPVGNEARVLLLSATRMRNTALLVNRLVGMHADSSLHPWVEGGRDAEPAPTVAPLPVRAEAVLGARWVDAEHAEWRSLDLAALVGLPDFLEVAAPAAQGAPA